VKLSETQFSVLWDLEVARRQGDLSFVVDFCMYERTRKGLISIGALVLAGDGWIISQEAHDAMAYVQT
jgi:hypothetical protein